MAAILEVEQLTKRYGDVVAVDGVDLSVSEGEIFGILGLNGAGKTTMVECAQGLRRPDAGSVRLLGRDPGRERSALASRVGSQLQDSNLPERMRVSEAVKLFADRRVSRDAVARVGARRAVGQVVRIAVGRSAAAAVHRPGAPQRARDRVPRRAHPGPRPVGAAGRLGPRQADPRPGDDRRARHPLHRRGRDPLRPGRGDA